MPIPAPGTYDVASQLSLLAVKAKTDLIPAAPAQQAKIDTSLYSSRLAPVVWTGVGAISVVIQPPAGETWDVYISVGGDATAIGAGVGQAIIEYWNGATAYLVKLNQTLTSATDFRLAVQARMQLTNALYARIRTVATAANWRSYYNYWGWRE